MRFTNSTMITAIAVLMLLSASAVLATETNFDVVPVGDDASDIVLDVISFSGERWRVADAPMGFSRLSGRVLGDLNGGGVDDLTLTFNAPQRRVEFDFVTRGGDAITVNGYLDSELVFSREFIGMQVSGTDAEDAAVVDTTVDSIVISSWANRAAIDNLRVTDGVPQLGAFDPGDNRINPHDYAPIAIYCRENGVDIYWISPNGTGIPILFASTALQEAVPTNPAEDTVITSAGNVTLYRLTTGDFYATAGPDAEDKHYSFLWDTCPPTRSATYIRDLDTGEETLTETRSY